MTRWHLAVTLSCLLVARILLAPDTAAAIDRVVGCWTFVARTTLPDGQQLVVRGKFIVHPDGTMIMTDDGGYARGLPRQTIEALSARGVRIGQGPALGIWALDHRGVFTFRVTRFLNDHGDVLGASLGIQVIQGVGVFDAKHAKWEFVNGYPVKWEGPDFDASKNELAIETIEIAHEGFTLSG